MGIRNAGSVLSIACDYCGSRILATDTGARVGIHGGNDTIDARLIYVHAGRCRDGYQQFFLNQAHRELTIAQIKTELGALA